MDFLITSLIILFKKAWKQRKHSSVQMVLSDISLPFLCLSDGLLWPVTSLKCDLGEADGTRGLLAAKTQTHILS